MDFEPDNLDEQVIDNGDPEAAPRRSRSRQLSWLVLAGVVGLSLCLTATVLLLQGPMRGLRPFRADPTSIALIIDGQPVLVTFPELSENAAAYHDQRIRVTGFYLPLATPDCSPYNGPIFNWSLVSEGLQLNAQGFERALGIIAPGTTLTVEGIWRLYAGPAGCGKEPETNNVWYLQVERIIQPNPLVAGTADPQAFLLSGISTPVFPTVGPTPTRDLNSSATPIGTPTHTNTPITSGTVTAVSGTPALTPTTIGTIIATPTPLGTIMPTGTRPSGTLTPTPTGTLSVTPGGTTLPPTPTSPNPYPGPGNTPVPPTTPSPTPGY